MCIKNLQSNITKILNSSVAHDKEQRVRCIEQEQQQRVIDNTPITTIPRITNAPPIMHSRNPTAKCHLKKTPRTHWRQTRNNTLVAVPLITRIEEHAIQHVVHKKMYKSISQPKMEQYMLKNSLQLLPTKTPRKWLYAKLPANGSLQSKSRTVQFQRCVQTQSAGPYSFFVNYKTS